MILRIAIAPLALLCLVSTSHAQPSTEERAAAYKTLGKVAFGDGDFTKCAEHFQTSHDLVPNTKLLFNVGLCLEKAGDFERARVAFQSFIAMAPNGSRTGEARTRIELLDFKMRERDRAKGVNVPVRTEAESSKEPLDELPLDTYPPESPQAPLPPGAAVPPPVSSPLVVDVGEQTRAPEYPTSTVGFGFFGYGLGSGKHTNIRGLSINLFPGYTRSVRGYQLGFVNIVRREMVGAQFGYFYNQAGLARGLQFAAANYAREVRGLQFGAFNVASRVTGAQLGLLNYTRHLKGIQLGILNVATHNWLPVMVGLNAGF